MNKTQKKATSYKSRLNFRVPLTPQLTKVLNEARSKGYLPSEMKQGIISLIHKKGDRDEIRNYRPITLLNGDYKIFTRVLTKRLNMAVSTFVSSCQKGFVPRSFIAEATMMLNLISQLMESEEEESGCVFMFLDMEKAFDRVSYDFILKAATAVGMGSFVDYIKLMYNVDNPPERRISANGYLSNSFQIKSGVAQGCPLSPLLFLLVAAMSAQFDLT